MALKIWLPFNGNLDNKGTSETVIASSGSSTVAAGKIGSCTKITSQTAMKYTPDFNKEGLTIGGWFKFNQAEISAVLSTLSYTSTASTPCGGLLSNSSYGGIGLIWTGNNYYTAGSFTGMSVFSTIRTSTVNKSTSSIVISFDTWTHIMLTWDPATRVLALYKDGTLYSSTTLGDFTDGVSRELQLNYKAIYGGNGPSASIPFYANEVRIYNHALTAAEIHELSQGLVLHYKLDDRDIEGTTNLVTSITSGGQTTVSNGVVTTSGSNADTYFTLNLSESITSGVQYTISCDADIPNGLRWCFPLGQQSNTSLLFYIANGHNEYTFTANNISWGENRCFLDDNNSSEIRASGLITRMWNFQIEKKAHATPFAGYGITRANGTTVKDSSGHRYDGTITGSLTIDGCSRYSRSAHIGATSQYIKCGAITTTGYANSYSFSWWSKCDKWSNVMNWGFSDGIRLNGIYNGILWNTGDGSNNPLYNPGTTTQVTAPTTGVWHHFVMTGDGTSCKVYKDGVYWATAKTYKAISGTQIYINGWDTGTSYKYSNLSMSDFRIYSTCLSAEDVLALYKVEAKVPKPGEFYAYEFIENEDEAITNNGQIKAHNVLESPISELVYYDKTIYVEPDGSQWVRVFHHNNPANARFASGANWKAGVYLDADRWFDIYPTVETMFRYEIMVKQKTTSSASEVKYRWIQNVSPLTAVWDDVKPASVTRITTSGYTDGTFGGLFIKNSSTHMVIANSNNGNWYGATGCWTAYNGGIPGFPNSIVTSGYMDIYVRIYPNAKIIKNIGFTANRLIEM